jgi:diguanylate cyclase (GGDEF)-like protein
MGVRRTVSWRHAAAAACLFFFAAANASDAAQKALREADAIRSSDHGKFSRVLRQVELRSDLDSLQREHLSYLQAYEAAYATRYEESLAKARLLANAARDPAIRVRAGSLVVSNYAQMRKFADGLRQLESTLAVRHRTDDTEANSHVLYSAALLYVQIGQYRLAERYADMILNRRDVAARTRCFASERKYEAMFNLRTLPVHNRHLDAAIAHCNSIGELGVANLMRGILARKMAAAGQRNAAIKLIQDAMPEIEATRLPELIGQMNSLLAEILLWEGRLPAAKHHAEIALQHGGKISRSLSLVAAYRVLYEVAEKQGKAVEALRYYKQYAQADVDYLNEVNAREMAYQTVRQELAAQSQKITLLNRQNEVLKLQQQVDRQSATNMRMLTGLLLVLAAAIAYWALRVKRMENVLRRQTQVDSLTGVASRQHFMREAEGLLRRYKAEGTQVALVMFDLDNFKAVNDRYGHAVGDWVLKRAADACSASCRRGDLIGRLGGEEFAMLLCDVPAEGAVRAAEACRAAIRRIDSSETGHVFQPGASFGICLASRSGYDLTAMLSHADKALYRAKHDGRNCVRMHGEDGLGDCLDAATRPSLRLAHSTGATEA